MKTLPVKRPHDLHIVGGSRWRIMPAAAYEAEQEAKPRPWSAARGIILLHCHVPSGPGMARVSEESPKPGLALHTLRTDCINDLAPDRSREDGCQLIN